MASSTEMTCAVTTPEKLVHEGSARLVVVPAIDGELGVMPHHAPLMALLGAGEMRIHGVGGLEQSIFVRGGFVQVADNTVNVLATEAEPAGEIDRAAAEAEAARLRAERPARMTAGERAEYGERLRAAEIRARIAARGAGPRG